ncbi:MAG: histone deacetylase [Thermoguttaceae bacterium]|jgi:acetoin utilization deacetylase AcuC-like enzyme
MTLLYSDLRFLEHQTGMHPEQPGRLPPVVAHLTATWLAAQCRQPEFERCDRQRLALVHSRRYIDEVWAFARSGGGDIDPDTVVCPASYHVARLAAGAVCDAVCRVVAGEDTTALCLVRPPGHHALADRAMGFCLFNNVAVAAATAVAELGLDRVLIVDFDVHHGNGTQAAFWTDPRVGFLSIHRWPFYPGSGSADERGAGRGLGSTLNLPITFGTRRQEYLAEFRSSLAKFADRVRPQLILVSAGFDAHRQDPLGNLGLETEDYATITEAILEAAAAHAGGRVVSTLEGGYNPPVLAQCVAEHLLCLVDHGRKV